MVHQHWPAEARPALLCFVHVLMKTAGAGSEDALFSCQCTFHLWRGWKYEVLFFFFLPPKLNTWALYNWTYRSIFATYHHNCSCLLETRCYCSSYPSTTFPPTSSHQALNRSLMYPSANSRKVSMAFWSVSSPQCVTAHWFVKPGPTEDSDKR